MPTDGTDLYPPGTVRDLQLVVKDRETMEMTFTAPGDDLDYGTGTRVNTFACAYVFLLSC